MTEFRSSEWAVVLPRRRTGIFSSPYLQPATIVSRETGEDIKECDGCGQEREAVAFVDVGDDCAMDVCADCQSQRG